MKEKDIIQRFIFEHSNVRGEIVRLHHSYQEIVQQHTYPLSIRRILGEFLVSAALLSAIIKFKGRLSVQFQSSGVIKLLLAQCNEKFQLRALGQWQKELKEDDLAAALQAGQLAVIINPDNATNQYQGIVAWQGNSLAHSIENYFATSEQLPTRLWIAVNEAMATGLLLQRLPQESTTGAVEDKWQHLLHLTETITTAELLELDIQTLLYRLYSQEQVRLFEAEPVEFRCTCSVERCRNAVFMLGEEEAEAELKEKQSIVVTCEFCNKEYTFDRVDVAGIFKQGGNAQSNQVH